MCTLPLAHDAVHMLVVTHVVASHVRDDKFGRVHMLPVTHVSAESASHVCDKYEAVHLLPVTNNFASQVCGDKSVAAPASHVCDDMIDETVRMLAAMKLSASSLPQPPEKIAKSDAELETTFDSVADSDSASRDHTMESSSSLFQPANGHSPLGMMLQEWRTTDFFCFWHV